VKEMSTRKSEEKVTSRIRDRTIATQGFDRFISSSTKPDGNVVVFRYPAGVCYEVPVGYILEWFDESGGGQPSDGIVYALRSRLISNGQLARVYLSDGRHCDVAWDTVLMACEPLYEHYGGLSKAAQEMTQGWLEKHGSFQR
jgi:hypothetical protein